MYLTPCKTALKPTKLVVQKIWKPIKCKSIHNNYVFV